jgi:serine/threonine-protein kinase
MELERIITKTMAKTPEERYQHVEEIIVDLRAIEKNLVDNVTKRVDVNPGINRINMKPKQTPVLWIISAILITIVVTVWLTKISIPLPERSIIRFVHSLPADQKLELFKFYGSAVIISPMGNMLVYSATDSSGVTMLYRRSIDQFQSTAITGTEGAGSPFFSPDGKWVGFFADGKLNKISLMGGRAISICNAQSGYGASWGPDDSIIFSPTFTSGLLIVSADGGTPKILTKLNPNAGELSHRWPEILPDGQTVLYTIDSGMDGDNKQIAIYEKSTGQQRTLITRGTNARYSDEGYIVYLIGGMLMAVPFDLDEMEVTGTAIRALDGVQSSAAGGGQFSFSNTGVLVWVPADELTYLN